MSNRNANLREKYLDAERLFRQYCEIGESRSISLLTEWAISQGMQSSSGNPPTPMGIWKAMWRWASMKENKEKAWNIAKDHIFGTSLQRFKYTRDRWNKEMVLIRIPTAWQHQSEIKKQKFMKENGWI